MVGIDPRQTAVLVIDMQNDFGSPRGMFDLAGIDIRGIAAAAEATRPVLSAARTAEIPIVYVRMEHAPDLSDVGPDDGPHWIKHIPMRVCDEVTAPDGSPSRILVRGTWNTEILENLAPEAGDHVVSKHRYSAFFETGLYDLLQRLGAPYLLVTGCTTSICVESTVRDAFFRDYKCLLLADCTAEPVGGSLARTNHEATLHLVQAFFGWVAESAALLGALERAGATATVG